jgi:hypothetical protein
MKNQISKFSKLAAVSVLFSASMAFADNLIPSTVEVPAPVKIVFTPKGFDSNDNAEIVVHGAYPNSCYKMGPTTVSVNKETGVVDVNVRAYYTMNSMCLMVYIPFTQVIPVGVLKQGNYTVNVNGKFEEVLPVALASNEEQDAFIYATITSLSRKSNNVFQLQGYLPSTCSTLEEVRVIEEPGNVLAVLPIVKMLPGCDDKNVTPELHFTVDFAVKTSVKGQKLIHVRSLNGSSLNLVVEL